MRTIFKSPLSGLVYGLALILIASPASAIIKRIDQTITLGPVVLHEEARFEVCANSKFITENIGVTVRFVRVRDGASLVERFPLGPGQNGCAAISFEQAGSAPIFATVDTFGTDLPEIDLVVSSAIVNGIFFAPKPQLSQSDEGVSTSTVYGPLVIPEGNRITVCSHNDREQNAAPVTVNFYLADQSRAEEPPVSTGEVFLEPGTGACTSLTAERAGGRDVLVELLTDPVEPGFANPLPVSGAFIINGIFDSPLPPDFRFLCDAADEGCPNNPDFVSAPF